MALENLQPPDAEKKREIAEAKGLPPKTPRRGRDARRAGREGGAGAQRPGAKEGNRTQNCELTVADSMKKT